MFMRKPAGDGDQKLHFEHTTEQPYLLQIASSTDSLLALVNIMFTKFLCHIKVG